MHEFAVTDIHTDMRQFAFNPEKKDIANLQVIACHWPHGLPLGRGCPWDVLARIGIGVMYKPAAIETGW